MSNTPCSVCEYEKTHKLVVDDSKTATEWSTLLGVHRTTVSRHIGHGTSLNESERTITEEDSDGRVSIEFIRDRPITLKDADDWVRAAGKDPDDYVISARSIAYGGDKASNRMSAYPRPGRHIQDRVVHKIDPTKILEQLRKAHVDRSFDDWALSVGHDASTFVISLNDIQFGQSYNGGSAATLEQFYRHIELVVERVSQLRLIGRRLENLVIIGGGDLVEGCTIYPNQSFSLDLNRKEQIEGIVAIILHTIDTLAPMFEHVQVLACAGNHGQHRINGNYTTLDDNDDTHAFEMAKLALQRDTQMQHVDWTIATSEAGVTTRVYDWVLATTHGDIYAKGVTGATIDKKAHNWFKNMAVGREKFGELGLADVLVTHHFHHQKVSDWGACLWIQTPSQDRGSPYFENATGEYSLPGMLTGVITPGRRWQDEEIVRATLPVSELVH